MFVAVRLEVVAFGTCAFAASVEGASVPDVAISPCLVTAEESCRERSIECGKAVFTAGSVILDIKAGRLDSRLVSSPIGRPLNAKFSFGGDRGDVGFVSG